MKNSQRSRPDSKLLPTKLDIIRNNIVYIIINPINPQKIHFPLDIIISL